MAAQTEARLGYVPHFEVTTFDGHRVRYREIWQHRALVLVVVRANEREDAASYALLLKARQGEFEDAEATVVVTADAVPGLSPRKVVIPRAIFQVDELLAWVRFAQMQCPECPP
jgi:hypothetical protein